MSLKLSITILIAVFSSKRFEWLISFARLWVPCAILAQRRRKLVGVEVKHRRFLVFKRGRKAVYLTCPWIAKVLLMYWNLIGWGRGPTRGPHSENFPVSNRGRNAVYMICPKIAKDYWGIADRLQFNRVRQVPITRALVWEPSSLKRVRKAV